MAPSSEPSPPKAASSSTTSEHDPTRLPPFVHNAFVAIAVISPLAMLLPPRKMDLRFLVLSGAFSFSTDRLVADHTGQGIYQRVTGRFAAMVPSKPDANTFGMPESALRTQKLFREEKERRAAAERRMAELGAASSTSIATAGAAGAGGQQAGGERDKAGRLSQWQKDQQALEEGKGLSGIILDQVYEVFGWRGKDGENEAKRDETKTR